jgi:hypothetical protein
MPALSGGSFFFDLFKYSMVGQELEDRIDAGRQLLSKVGTRDFERPGRRLGQAFFRSLFDTAHPQKQPEPQESSLEANIPIARVNQIASPRPRLLKFLEPVMEVSTHSN